MQLVGRAAAAYGRFVDNERGSPARLSVAPALLKASDIYAAGKARCHGGSVTEDTSRLGTYWGCDGR